MRKLIGLIVAVLAAVLAIPMLGGAGILGGGGGTCVPVIQASTATAPATLIPVVPSGGPIPAIEGWDAEQLAHVATIITAGNTRAVPPWGWVVAVATAIQESGLRDLTGGADDSIGLFQQRPSHGWGTPHQLTDPAYQAGKYFDKLVTIDGWHRMPLTDAAQAVQRSSYPDAYERHTSDAIDLVTNVAASLGIPADLGQCGRTCPAMGAEAISCTSMAEVFVRAQRWLTAWSGGPVPYLSSGNTRDWFEGYRRDCSGYVSMALGLDGPGLNTTGLAARSAVIPKTDLRPGDLLVNPSPELRGHVVLFERWADGSMSSYYGYEQSGDGGTHHRVIPYPYFGGYPMRPYRLGK